MVFLWWNSLFVGKVFGFVWNEDEFVHLLGLVAYLCDVTCTFPLQEIHDLFKDYEIKYCYVDRNKRTGENLKLSSVSVLWGTPCAVCDIMDCHSLSGVPQCLFCHIPLTPVKAGNFLLLIRSFLVPSGLCSFGTKLISAAWIPRKMLLRPLLEQTPRAWEENLPSSWCICSLLTSGNTSAPWGSPSTVRGCGISIPWDPGSPSEWPCVRNRLDQRPSGGPCHPHGLKLCEML